MKHANCHSLMLGGSVFIGGVLLGIIVGAVSGVLFAPRSGEDTRDLLCKQADELGETITGNGKRLIAKEPCKTCDTKESKKEKAESAE